MLFTTPSPVVKTTVRFDALTSQHPFRIVATIGIVVLFPTVDTEPTPIAPCTGVPFSFRTTVTFPTAVGVAVTAMSIV